MKKIIIIAFSVMLGVYVFGLILGDGNSVRNAGSDVMRVQAEQLNMIP